MQKTLFHITKMDCPSEENLLRLKLSEINNVKHLDFDIENRKLSVYHVKDLQQITDAINSLSLGEKIIETLEVNEDIEFKNDDSKQRKLLWIVLGINFIFN